MSYLHNRNMLIFHSSKKQANEKKKKYELKLRDKILNKHRIRFEHINTSIKNINGYIKDFEESKLHCIKYSVDDTQLEENLNLCDKCISTYKTMLRTLCIEAHDINELIK